MNDSEARRRQLLYETRNLYKDRNSEYAVHPRYRISNVDSNKSVGEVPKSSLKIRIILSVICFVCYIMVNYGNIEIAHFDSEIVHQEISRQMQFYKISEVLE